MALHVYNTTANADSIYYVQTDLLGSWDRIVDGSKAVVQSSHFDPWGNRKSTSNWTLAQDGTAFSFHRGFTGHEHYDRFGIINMNARLYDPVIARFFSPDPQVQNPYSTQGFNRYTYCGNNPVMNTDPYGESFIIDSWIHGFLIGLFDNKYTSAWSSANHHALNDIKIWGGLFVPNSNKNFWGQAWEIISRFTWQAPQTLAGFKYAQICNNYHAWGGIDNISYYDGATVITNFKTGEAAITLGSYINGKNSLAPDPGNSTFQHEYGHYIQSQSTGVLYLQHYGIPSALNCVGKKDHDYHPAEQDANIRAFKYYNEKYHNYSAWDFENNPIRGYDINLPYHHPCNQIVMDNGRLRPAWYNYFMLGDFCIAGIINYLVLEKSENYIEME